MAITIAIANEKGGVAKTTTTASLGSILADKGYKVVMVDLDPQGDLTTGLNKEFDERNIYDSIFTHKQMSATNVNPGLVLIGGDSRMNPVSFDKSAVADRDFKYITHGILKKALESLKDQADLILLDCPPNVDIVTANALIASDYVIIPTEAHKFAINGIESILSEMGTLKSQNPNLSLLGILITRYRGNTAIHSQMEEALREKYSGQVFKTPIKENITLQEVSHEGQEIVAYDKERQSGQLVKSKFAGIKDYEQVAEELLSIIFHNETKPD